MALSSTPMVSGADDPSFGLSRRAFSETSDPESYLPRDATEEVLREIGLWADSDDLGSTLAALLGSLGLGKTLLLRLIETRAVQTGDRRAALYLPYAGLGPQDLCRMVYGLLGEALPVPASADEAMTPASAIDALMQLGQPTSPFFILIDDADSMPTETIDAIVEHFPVEFSPVRIFMAVNPDPKAKRLLGRFRSFDPPLIAFRDHMSDEEAEFYLRGRMRWAGFPQVEIDRLSTREAKKLNSTAKGNPRRLHVLAATRFAPEEAPLPAEPAEADDAEEWNGELGEDDLISDDGDDPVLEDVAET